MSPQSSSESQSTEPPSSLQQGLEPVKLKYIALPNPINLPSGDLVTMTATDEFRPPCRRCLLDAQPGEVVNLISYDPFPSDSVTPYRGESPIFVHADGCKPFSGDHIPERQLRRLLSLRAYDEKHFLAAAEVVEGKDFEEIAGQMLADRKASYINVHNAKPGCFALKVERAK